MVDKTAATEDESSKPVEAEQSDKPLGQHSLNYLLGSVVALLGSIVLLPVYTRALDPADYGLLETLLRLVGLFSMAAFGGLQQGYLRFFFDDSKEHWQKTLTSTAVAGVFVVSAVCVVPLTVGIATFAEELQIPQFSLMSSMLLVVWLAFEAVYSIGLSFLQVRFFSSRYLLAQSGRVLLLVFSNYVFLHFLGLGLNGALLGNLCTAVFSGVVSAAFLLKWSGMRVSMPTFKDLAWFGAPYIPTMVFGYVFNNADRLSLLYFGFGAALGLFSLAAKLGGMALAVLSAPMSNLWMPYAFSVYEQPDGPDKIGLLYLRFIAIMIFLALATSLAAPLAIRLLATAAYADAAALVPLVAIAYIFFATASLADIGVLIAKRTVLKPIICAAVAIIAVSLHLVLTPRGGLVGAITATTLTAISYYLITSYVSRLFYRFKVDQRVLLIIIVAAAGSFWLGLIVANAFPSITGSLLSIGIGLLTYVIVVHFTRLLTYGDVMDLVSGVLRRGKTGIDAVY